MKRFISLVVITGCLAITIVSCEKDRGINLFSVSQDIEFGRIMDSTINADRTEFPILDPNQYADVYTYINGMMEDILESEKIKYKTQFPWQVTIINKDVMNAFAVPGGKLYFYTGLIKYLDDAASLAGILAHEIAHIDLRHSTKTLTDLYGFSLLVSLLLGDNSSQLAQIAGDLATGAAGLKFSRNHEYDADRYSMYYLSTTKYHPKGIESFFVKLQDEGKTAATFEFLSTHPSDQNRIDQINSVWETDSYLTGKASGKTYDYFKQEFINQLISKLP